jgi:diguanylate cyclase (GGDEF)-like protein
MSVANSQSLGQFLKERRILTRAFTERLQAAAGKDDLDAIFDELGQLRSSIKDIVKPHSDQLRNDQWIELQSELNAELDASLSAAVSALIECRMRSLAESAQRDPLTTLLNRAAFDRRLSDEVERARRYRREMSVVLFDVDRFKLVNDRFGHPAGDQVLLKVADTLQRSLRQSDSVYRYGGDEFAAICPETNGGAVISFLRRIELNVMEKSDQVDCLSSISISWGIASFPHDANQADELLMIADQRLYDCKREHHKNIER